VLPGENRQQIQHFVSERADINEVPIDASWGLDGGPGRQILPGQGAMDGFYYAVLEKR
jgi:16S rRNA (cytosine967-C5)-methyltransferase